MRIVIAVLALLAVPALAAAQQADAQALDVVPSVQLEQTTVAPSATPAPSVDAVEADVEMQTQNAPADEVVAVQDPSTRSWWYLVGAIVVGGVILAILL